MKSPDSALSSPWERAALAAIFLLVAVLAWRQVGSLDAGFHLRAGERILAGEGWPTTDPFTFTVTDHVYLDTTWGYQVVVAGLVRLFGVGALTPFHAALVLATFGLLYMTVRLVPGGSTRVLLLLLIGVLAAEQRFQARPEVLSYAFLAGLLYLLHRHAERRASPLWLLPPIFLAWANCHSLFVLGWIALACFVLGLWERDRRLDRRLVGWSLGSVAVTLLNPYGYRALFFPFTLLTRFDEKNVFAETIGELTSPFALGLSDRFPFYPKLPIFAFYALYALVLLAQVDLVRRRRRWCTLLALPFLFLAAGMVRNMPLLVVSCLPGAVWGLRAFRLREAARRGARFRRWVAVAVIVVCAVLTLRVSHDAYYVATRRADRFGVGWNRTTLPVAAADYTRRVELPGRMLNHLGFGGYLMWATRQPVFIDGRLEVIGERFYEEYQRILASESELERAVRRYGIGWVALDYKLKPDTLRRLSRDSRWRLGYVDALAAIFVRSGPAITARIDESARAALGPPLELAPLERLPGLGSRSRPGRLARWSRGLLRRERFPQRSFSLGLFHYFRGDPSRAAPWFAAAIEESDGAYYEIYNNLGSALYRLGRLDAARRCYLVVLDDVPSNALARKRLSEIDAAR